MTRTVTFAGKSKPSKRAPNHAPRADDWRTACKSFLAHETSRTGQVPKNVKWLVNEREMKRINNAGALDGTSTDDYSRLLGRTIAVDNSVPDDFIDIEYDETQYIRE
jgi:hypothetical protein